MDNAEDYCEDVTAWAKSVLEDSEELEFELEWRTANMIFKERILDFSIGINVISITGYIETRVAADSNHEPLLDFVKTGTSHAEI